MTSINDVDYAKVGAIEMGEANKQENLGRRHAGSVLEWAGVNYTVPGTVDSSKPGAAAAQDRTLLMNMSGVVRPGTLTGIMGSSGAGKSTLLDVLAGRLEAPTLKGTLTVNGRAIDKASFRKETGYVMQSDALFPLLTVKETVRYAAYLRIADKTTEEKNHIADTVIKLLRLENCQNTIIGDAENRGLSGGEMRRVSIAVDIVHFPAIIFLDEPTSGLDSTTALSVVDSLKTLALQMNCTIVMTIHQPSNRLFSLLDRVIFLARGQVTYDGEVSELPLFIREKYQEAMGEQPPVANPPEVFLDLTDALVTSDRLHLVTKSFEKGPVSVKSLLEGEGTGARYANDFFSETGILMSRQLTNILRTPELFMGRLMSTIFFGILIGTLFLNTPDNTVKGLNFRLSYFVFTLAFYYWTSLEALPIFLGEREIFQREFSRGAYRAISYTVSSTLIQLPFMLTLALVFNCITWFTVGLPNLAGLFWFNVLITFTVIVVGNGFATMFSVLVPNPMMGQTAGSGLFSVMFLFSGFFIKSGDIPHYWLWLHFSSLFKYAYDSMISNAFRGHGTFTLGNVYYSNNDVLSYYSVHSPNRGMGVGILWGWLLVFRIVFYYRLLTAFSGSRKK